jgi:hypothetical protein
MSELSPSEELRKAAKAIRDDSASGLDVMSRVDVNRLVAEWLDQEAEGWEVHSETEQWFVAAPNGDDPTTASPAWLLARTINWKDGQS